MGEGSNSQYDSALRSFKAFAISVGYTEEEVWDSRGIRPLDNEIVSLWIAELIEDKQQANTISGKLSALAWQCDIIRRKHKLDDQLITTMRKTANRKCTRPPVKAPVMTPAILRKLAETINDPNFPRWGQRLLLFLVLGFTGFLRISEALMIRAGDVTWGTMSVSIFFKHRKGDRYRCGRKVYFAKAIRGKLCPFTLLKEWMGESPWESNRPLFVGRGKATAQGSACISSTTIIKQLSITCEKAKIQRFLPRSLRAGGATTAKQAGVTDADIAKHGDWQDLFTTHGYIAPTRTERLVVSETVVRRLQGV